MVQGGWRMVGHRRMVRLPIRIVRVRVVLRRHGFLTSLPAVRFFCCCLTTCRSCEADYFLRCCCFGFAGVMLACLFVLMRRSAGVPLLGLPPMLRASSLVFASWLAFAWCVSWPCAGCFVVQVRAQTVDNFRADIFAQFDTTTVEVAVFAPTDLCGTFTV